MLIGFPPRFRAVTGGGGGHKLAVRIEPSDFQLLHRSRVVESQEQRRFLFGAFPIHGHHFGDLANGPPTGYGYRIAVPSPAQVVKLFCHNPFRQTTLDIFQAPKAFNIAKPRSTASPKSV